MEGKDCGHASGVRARGGVGARRGYGQLRGSLFRCMLVSPFLPSRNLQRILASILPPVATTPFTPPLAAESSAAGGTGGGAQVRVTHVLWTNGMRLSRCEARLEPSFPGVLSTQFTTMLHGSSRLRASLVFASTSIRLPRPPRTHPPTQARPRRQTHPPTPAWLKCSPHPPCT